MVCTCDPVQDTQGGGLGGVGGRGGDVDGHEVGNGKGVDREFDGEGLQQMNTGSEIQY